jgi:uncharacterized membrane protein
LADVASAKGRYPLKFVKLLLSVLGVLMILMGGLWIGQGLNVIKWPETSFMIGVPQWSWNGSILALAGAVVLWWSRRK